MIIPALIRRYDHEAQRCDSGIAPPGYSEQQVSFKVVITSKGELHSIEPVFVEVPILVKTKVPSSKSKSSTSKSAISRVLEPQQPEVKFKLRSIRLIVPGQNKPTGKGINPCTLWDNSAYMLGYKTDDPNPSRSNNAFIAFRAHHAEVAQQIDDNAVNAVAKFLASWQPLSIADYPDIDDWTTNFGVFQLLGEPGYIHQRIAFKHWWNSQQFNVEDIDAKQTSADSFSLSDGRTAPIARLHEPKIKGVAGAQSTGATLVSFNADAFNSFGKEQGTNAPLAQADAFKYCTALNTLTTDDRHRVRIAGDTYVFWSEPPPDSDDLVSPLFIALLGSAASRPALSTAELNDFMSRVRVGQVPPNSVLPTRLYIC